MNCNNCGLRVNIEDYLSLNSELASIVEQQCPYCATPWGE